MNNFWHIASECRIFIFDKLPAPEHFYYFWQTACDSFQQQGTHLSFLPFAPSDRPKRYSQQQRRKINIYGRVPSLLIWWVKNVASLWVIITAKKEGITVIISAELRYVRPYSDWKPSPLPLCFTLFRCACSKKAFPPSPPPFQAGVSSRGREGPLASGCVVRSVVLRSVGFGAR